MLIVRGVEVTDDLIALGLPFAYRFDQSDNVVLIGESGAGFMAKGAEDPWIIEFFDATGDTVSDNGPGIGPGADAEADAEAERVPGHDGGGQHLQRDRP
jgi:hypothetical protein